MKTFWMMAAVMSASALSATAFAAQGTVLVAPTRLTIAPGARSGEAGITNVSDKPLRYKMTLQDMVMTASGTTVQVSGTSKFSAQEMLRFMPRVVDLAPGQRQTIRVMVTRPDGLEDGDYHTHLLFDELVQPVSATEISGTAPPKRFNVDIGVSYSMGIPVVVQQGTLTGELKVLSAQMSRNAEGKTNGVTLRVQRSGNSEGQLKVTGELNGKDVLTMRNLRMYRELDEMETFITFNDEALVTQPQEVTLHFYPINAGKNTPELGRMHVK